MPSTGHSPTQRRIKELEKEIELLKKSDGDMAGRHTVIVPESFRPLFDRAEQTVNEYFRDLRMDPEKGTIEINDQRYVLVRASALSKDFLETIQNLYSDRGEVEAMNIGKNFLFDIAHVIGMNDSRNFHQKMNLTDPVAKLSAGPIHFAHSGWASVEILPESTPVPGDDFYLVYRHPYSFEADSWQRAGKKTFASVCIMNAGYSSGWCEESFGIPLTAVEVTCRARGDEHCTFIMSPPGRIQARLESFHSANHDALEKPGAYEIPTFFDRKRVEEEMQRSQLLAEESAKMKADFVANISHELRTPLGTIIGFADLLKKTPLTEEQAAYLAAVSESGESLIALISDVLDLAKMDAGKFAIEETPFDINQVMSSIKTMFAQRAAEKKLAFTCVMDEEIGYLLSGDPLRLKQVLINLVGNAIKFTDEGSVSVHCRVENKSKGKVDLLFTIRDTGIGIPVDKRAMIFERFTQGDSNTTRKYGGSGLGLAITKQLIEAQGGAIELSGNENNGTTFLCRLTYAISAARLPSPVENIERPRQAGVGTKNILVVEDNLLNQKLAIAILENLGAVVTIASDGQQAIGLLKKNECDLILMDLQMPGMDGYETTRILRRELLCTTPVLACTAHAYATEKENCLLAGMNGYLSKPYDQASIAGKIRELDERPLTVNFDYLKKQTGHNMSLIREMIGIFLKEHPLDMEKLKSAVEQNDHKTAGILAHSMRNATAFFGIGVTLGEPLLKIEHLAADLTDVGSIEALYADIAVLSAEVMRQMRAFHH